ncbi:DsbA family protein [Psychroserpens sp. Hel_I_66]|uniref:DsbA family protein n=1 Tax=Psychroserpens sp. Hel_I_66 TaxID=1250004 RepID=UPI00068F9842|nr:DsbA family protein [Psychroserpens sp. Hel_I_66]
MSQENEITMVCDPVTGLCELPDFESEATKQDWNDDEEIFYIGDPMCSWCWGISPQVNALKRFANQQHINMELIMGGLRPGGGQEWDAKFKSFLKHHWQEVNKRSGQPFNMDLLDKEVFHYDTEPACRAVITVRTVSPEKTLPFYELVQYYFYAESKDPKQLDFYKPICEKLDIDFTAFSEKFTSQTMKDATRADFIKTRELGVNGFPSIVYRKKDKFYTIARGYTEFDDIKKTILKLRNN